MDFDGVDNFLLYAEDINDHLLAVFKKEESFVQIEDKDVNNVTIDEFSVALYGSVKFWWLVPFFNPEIDLSIFGLKNSIESGEFIKTKIENVYVENLKKNYATQAQIENVFDTYYNQPIKTFMVPKPNVVKAIEKYIQDMYKKLVVGA